jgi:hypothetical protein
MLTVHPQFHAPTVDLSRVVSLTNPAQNSQDAQFNSAIEFLFRNGITNGVKDLTGDIHYYGDDMLTRGQFAALLYRFSGSPKFSPTTADNFNDTVNHQFSKEIAWLKNNKISTGDNGDFHPDANIKRGEIAKLIALAFVTTNEIKSANMFSTFVDLDQTSDLTEFIKYLGATGISQGTSTSAGVRYYPDNEISRGQIASLLYTTNTNLLS